MKKSATAIYLVCTAPIHLQLCIRSSTTLRGNIVYSYFMPVCSIVKTITRRCCGRHDALLYEAEGRVQLCIRSSLVQSGNSLTILQTDMK